MVYGEIPSDKQIGNVLRFKACLFSTLDLGVHFVPSSSNFINLKSFQHPNQQLGCCEITNYTNIILTS